MYNYTQLSYTSSTRSPFRLGGNDCNLEPYEEEVLLAMYDKGVIGMAYTSVQKIAAMIKWNDIARKYSVRRKFSKVLDRLHSKGYVDFHGKSRDVASLSRFGVQYAYAKMHS